MLIILFGKVGSHIDRGGGEGEKENGEHLLWNEVCKVASLTFRTHFYSVGPGTNNSSSITIYLKESSEIFASKSYRLRWLPVITMSSACMWQFSSQHTFIIRYSANEKMEKKEMSVVVFSRDVIVQCSLKMD